MRIGNFSVQVQPGRERGSGHVALSHNQTYALRLANEWYNRDCDAKVEIDGKLVGEFRVPCHAGITIERPVDEAKLFTFYALDSVEAEQVCANKVAVDLRGVVQVTFKPEYERVSRPVGTVRTGGPSGQSMGMFSESEEKTSDGITHGMETAGMTGLSGRSNQRFSSVAPLNYDESEMVVISLRLIALCEADHGSPSELKPIGVVRSNPVPSPLE